MIKKISIKPIVLILICAFALSGCAFLDGLKKPPAKKAPLIKKPPAKIKMSENMAEQLAAQSKIKKFASLEELKDFMETAAVSPSYGGLGRGMEITEESAMDFSNGLAAPQTMMKSKAEASAPAGMGMGEASDDYSKTNVQVEGVDEADIIKTDGKYIYAVVKNNLFIVNAYPADKAEVLAKIEFKSRPQDIYINGDSLVIYGRDNVFYKTDTYRKFRRRSNFTFFKVFDISDRKNPKQVKDLNFEGDYNNSRMIGDYVYFVTTNYNHYYIEDEPILPRIFSNGKEATKASADAKAGYLLPEIYYFDIPYSSYNFTTIAAVNVKQQDAVINREIYLMSANQNMYVSQNNIYIIYTRHISEYQLEMEVMREIVFPRLSAANQGKIAKIEQVENYILSLDEKRGKILRIIERYVSSLNEDEQDKLENDLERKVKEKYEDISKELEKTIIHKIDVNKGELEYKTNGEVTGQALNQFSMDEHNGYFRIATTKNRTWSRYEEERRDSYNNLYVLDENLKVVGAVENLAEGEKIYSVRFMQNRAYMVTFKQIDPLFVIDLTDPKNPKVLGKLKIPGYSDYLHPYDDTTLIGLGKDTGESEWGGVRVKGLKLSLFDVGDIGDPKEIDTYIMGDSGSNSIALHDHKAFLFSRDKNLLSIPVSIRESLEEPGWGKLTFSGAAVFSVDKKGFKFKGKIDHSDGGRSSGQDYWRGYSYYDNTVKRSLYIDDVLYTFSNQYLKMNMIDDLELVKKIRLKKERQGDDDDFEIIN